MKAAAPAAALLISADVYGDTGLTHAQCAQPRAAAGAGAAEWWVGHPERPGPGAQV